MCSSDLGRNRVEDEDREADSASTKLYRLVQGRDGETVHAAGLEPARRPEGAMPVRVGLDDRLEADAVGQAGSDGGSVRREAIEVDREPRGARQRWQVRGGRSGDRPSFGSRLP